jgi:hypothetical protein
MELILALLLIQDDPKKKAAEEADKALEQFKKDYANPDANKRADAVKALGKTQHEKILRVLAELLGKDDVGVREEAAKAIGAYKEHQTQAVAYLVAGIGANKEDGPLVSCYESLGELAEESGAAAANKGLESKETKVAKAAAEATGKIRSRTSLEPLVDLLQKLEKEGKLTRSTGAQVPGPNMPGSARTDANKQAKERQKDLKPAVIKALQSIAKEKYTTADDWDVWWKKNKATFKVEK